MDLDCLKHDCLYGLAVMAGKVCGFSGSRTGMAVSVLIMAEADPTVTWVWNYCEDSDTDANQIASMMAELSYHTGVSTRELSEKTEFPSWVHASCFQPGAVVDAKEGIAVACVGQQPDISEAIAQMFLAAIIGYRRRCLSDGPPNAWIPHKGDRSRYNVTKEGAPDAVVLKDVTLSEALNFAAAVTYCESLTPVRVTIHTPNCSSIQWLVCSVDIEQEQATGADDNPPICCYRVTPIVAVEESN